MEYTRTPQNNPRVVKWPTKTKKKSSGSPAQLTVVQPPRHAVFYPNKMVSVFGWFGGHRKGQANTWFLRSWDITISSPSFSTLQYLSKLQEVAAAAWKLLVEDRTTNALHARPALDAQALEVFLPDRTIRIPSSWAVNLILEGVLTEEHFKRATHSPMAIEISQLEIWDTFYKVRIFDCLNNLVCPTPSNWNYLLPLERPQGLLN